MIMWNEWKAKSVHRSQKKIQIFNSKLVLWAFRYYLKESYILTVSCRSSWFGIYMYLKLKSIEREWEVITMRFSVSCNQVVFHLGNCFVGAVCRCRCCRHLLFSNVWGTLCIFIWSWNNSKRSILRIHVILYHKMARSSIR